MIFYCEECHRNEDGDEVGYVVLPDGREVCARAADDLYADGVYTDDDEDAPQSLSQKREAMGGEYGGDGRDD